MYRTPSCVTRPKVFNNILNACPHLPPNSYKCIKTYIFPTGSLSNEEPPHCELGIGGKKYCELRRKIENQYHFY